MKGEWLRAAMADDNLVAELLLRFKQPDSHPLRPAKPSASLPPLDWAMRQPRSKAAASVKKQREATRRSPTTPLSWSVGGASPSDSYEESSKPFDRFVSVARSKNIATNDTTNSVGAGKRPRRKKTFAELKEEESALLKERRHLKKELDSLRQTLEEQRSCNDNFKRIKLDLQLQLVPKSVPAVDEHAGQHNKNSHCETEASMSEAAEPSNELNQVTSEDLSERHSFCPAQDGASNEQPLFVLPDLNMTPQEDCWLHP